MNNATTNNNTAKRITIRLTSDLRDRIRAAAESAGMPTAVWLRALAIREVEHHEGRREGRGEGGRPET